MKSIRYWNDLLLLYIVELNQIVIVLDNIMEILHEFPREVFAQLIAKLPSACSGAAKSTRETQIEISFAKLNYAK